MGDDGERVARIAFGAAWGSSVVVSSIQCKPASSSLSSSLVVGPQLVCCCGLQRALSPSSPPLGPGFDCSLDYICPAPHARTLLVPESTFVTAIRTADTSAKHALCACRGAIALCPVAVVPSLSLMTHARRTHAGASPHAHAHARALGDRMHPRA